VRCTECHTDWHMKCVKPPLPRKPTKGYHWACGPCIRARMKEMKANNIPMFELKKSQDNEEEEEEEEEEFLDDESEELSESGIPESAGPITRADTPVTNFDLTDVNDSGTNEGKFAARLWPYRYLGIHCKVEDVLDYQDRIYPRAASRLGPRHQAVVQDWPGRPVEYIEKRTINLDKLDKRNRRTRTAAVAKEGTETPDDSSIHTGIDEDRPTWIQEKPPGYVARGEDSFSTDGTGTQLIWKKPAQVTNSQIDNYLHDIRAEATRLKVPTSSTSFLDGAINALQYTSFNFTKAKDLVSTLTPDSLWNPIFTPDEIKRFESGVAKFGSELHYVAKEVGTKAPAECVRFYYMWKKTLRGREIWGKQEGRKGNRTKSATVAAAGVPDVGDSSDDSAFDDRKAVKQRKRFVCKFCSTETSRRWRKPPGGIVLTGDEATNILALCDRCGDLWRRYGVQYVVPEELKKPVEGKIPKKRRSEEEEEETGKKKKVKRDDKVNGKVIRRTRAGSIELPTWPPCAVCGFVEEEEPVVCTVCGLCVHAGCYGFTKKNRKGNWLCDMCINDKQPLVSTVYSTISRLIQEIRMRVVFNAGAHRSGSHRRITASSTLETHSKQ
jgi:PHD-finger